MIRTRAWAVGWAVARLVVAALVVAAILAQLERSVANARAATTPHGGDVPTVIANFLSFFTIQSNLAAAIVLTLAGVWSLTRGARADREPRGLAIALAAVTAYMLVTGVVYAVLLRGVELPQGVTVAWSNEVLHVVAPLFLAADLFLGPYRRRLPWSTVGVVVGYPIAWVVYTLARAEAIVSPATGASAWYPYPFLDPRQNGGYAGVAVYVALIAVAIVAVAFGVVAVGRRRASTLGAGRAGVDTVRT